MSSKLDLASTIGTWVAAGIGIIALIGIIGPALIWYASTRDRQKTLSRISNDNNNYISTGFHLGPNIWLRRRVHAPMLKDLVPGDALESLSTLQREKIKAVPTEPSWVLFGSLLEAYGVKFKLGDELVIRGHKALLPIHTSFLFVVGLLGRYADRQTASLYSMKRRPRFHFSRNRLLNQPSGPRLPEGTYTPPQSPGGEPSRPRTMLQGRVPAVELQYLEQDANRSEWHGDSTELYGTTGALEIRPVRPLPAQAASWSVIFEPSTPRTIHAEVLTLCDMFFLASGFIKTPQSQYISLGLMHEAYAGYAEDLEDDGRWSDSNSTSYSRGNDPYYPVPVPSRPIRFRAERRSGREPDTRPYIITASPDRGPNVYRIGIVELDRDMQRLATPFLAGDDTTYFGWRRIRGEEAANITAPLKGRTNVPSSSDWVRVEHNIDADEPAMESYIERIAAQRLSLGVLKMAWHPAGYLLGQWGRRGPGMAIFEAAAQRLPYFAYHLSNSLERLIPDKQRNSKLLGILKIHAALPLKSKEARLYNAAYKLELALADLGNRGERAYIDDLVGILAITNIEFRELVYDSLRSVREMTPSTAIQIEMPSATLKLPKAFGVMQYFFTDWQAMFPDEERQHETIDVSYADVVLATVRALVKCELLRSCPDANPLVVALMRMGDVGYMI
ncbi:hypothetical protein CC79DRAFT_462056 [Sarocladium strictum]